jgi:hypothetical protein
VISQVLDIENWGFGFVWQFDIWNLDFQRKVRSKR